MILLKSPTLFNIRYQNIFFKKKKVNLGLNKNGLNIIWINNCSVIVYLDFICIIIILTLF